MYEFHCYIFTFMNSREFKIIVVNLVNYNFVRFMAHLKCFCFLSTELRSFEELNSLVLFKFKKFLVPKSVSRENIKIFLEHKIRLR